MIRSAAQLKGKIKSLAHQDPRRAENLMRLFFMERFLERVSVSDYGDQFILKGGMLTASLLGVNMRTTMDIDTTVKALPLTEQDISKVINEICEIDMHDNVSFQIKGAETIMDDFEYPGVRLQIEGYFEKLRQAIKIDVSTDDVITPGAIEYEYKLLFDDRTIYIFSYNTETLLAEKIQTILSRGTANTRMRDFYDVYMLVSHQPFSNKTLSSAFRATCSKRKTVFSKEAIRNQIIVISTDKVLRERWNQYLIKNTYASPAPWNEVIIDIQRAIENIEL